DSVRKKVYASQQPIRNYRDSNAVATMKDLAFRTGMSLSGLHHWKVRTAIGGGPVLLSGGEVKITNNEELKFSGKAIQDKHPRTAIGYTADNRVVILVIEGRNPEASGATLEQEAYLLKKLGCVEGLNLDGGGSSCLLINGKETIKPSDKEGQRAVPAVFMIRQLNP
ncbi:MAG TPA: phosphodiester glycosidase family protein, partial [Flavisolibacter sp.]|nr:phosphodiester glycosidase family protein [Flavisolibacter sp.]